MAGSILTDADIVEAIESEDLKLEGFQLPQDPFAKDSPIQPSSLDLTVGEIYIPEDGTSGGSAKAETGWRLEPGQTAVVVTHEKVTFSDRVGAFGFPPTDVSSKGILMTNPGHIDPGFCGAMKFTVINMGKERFRLLHRMPIVTLLVFKFESSVKADYLKRRNGTLSKGSPEELVRSLSRDFVSVERRARAAAKSEIREAEFRIKWVNAMLPFVGAIIVAIIAGIFAFTTDALDFAKSSDLLLLRDKVLVLETTKSLSGLEERVLQLERKLK